MAPAIPWIAAISSLASAGASIASATNKPDVQEPTAVPNKMALMADRRRAAASQGSRGNILTSQKLGSIGS
jgi:hypothetical protein